MRIHVKTGWQKPAVPREIRIRLNPIKVRHADASHAEYLKVHPPGKKSLHLTHQAHVLHLVQVSGSNFPENF